MRCNSSPPDDIEMANPPDINILKKRLTPVCSVPPKMASSIMSFSPNEPSTCSAETLPFAYDTPITTMSYNKESNNNYTDNTYYKLLNNYKSNLNVSVNNNLKKKY